MDTLPSGTVTFLFTDIEDSTRLWQEQPGAMSNAHMRHDAILREAIESNHGHVFQIVGDSFSAAFHNAGDGIRAAVSAQRVLRQNSNGLHIRVRMGLHTGTADLTDDGKYDGYVTVASAQRVMSAAHGGQVLLSHATFDLLQDNLPENVNVRDLGEHRLKSLRMPLRLFQVVAPGLELDFPPLQSLDSFPNNLPPPLTSFIGRERELNEASKLIASVRLLTFIGPGGTGKTRLSLKVAAEQLPEFKDGVWLAELAPITDPANIVTAIASIFGLREVQNIPLNNIVLDYLRARQALLILDNCEHLIEASAQLADQILHTSPQAKIIASSREALGISGETVFRVPSLSTPQNLQDPGTSESLMTYEATRLFIERAAKAEPRFKVTEHNASAIAQICSRLDGIPLAIELAAARVKVFTPEQIAERLDDRFKLLTGGSRTALPRQQTLRALIDWSYQSLKEVEQRAFCRLAVFSGGWTFEAAESVLGENEAMEGLSGLVNKSLVNVEEGERGSRYRFLETVRQYALEKLVESGEAVEARSCHLDHFLAFAEDVENRLVGAARLPWLNVLELEHDNLRSALRWALENRPQAALRMVASLADFWLSRGYLAEGRNWCKAALDQAEKDYPSDDDNDRALARAFYVLAMLSINQGEHFAGKAAATEAIALARRTGDTLRLVRALNVFGLASAFLGEIDQAFDVFHQSENICRQMGFKEELAWVLVSLAYITMEVRGQAAGHEIQPYLEESLTLANDLGNRYTFRSIEIMARLAFNRGDIAESLRLSERAISHYRTMGDRHGLNSYRSGMAHALRQAGNTEQALALYRETITAWQELGHRGAVAHQLECFAFIARSQAQWERAVKLMGAAEVLREACGATMTPRERLEYDREVSDLRTGMNEKALASLWMEGRLLTMEQAVKLAATVV